VGEDVVERAAPRPGDGCWMWRAGGGSWPGWQLHRALPAHLDMLDQQPAAGAHTIGELTELFPITRSTIYRAVARAGGRSAPVWTTPPASGA
jgi:hypothetical protein